jgi:16S rRNA processing protein RimM
MTDGERVLLGRIVAAHGIRGDVLVRTYTEAADAIGRYGPLSDANGRGAIKLRILRVTAKGVVARVAGVSDRNGAEALAGTDLYVARGQLPAAEEGEFYHADLVGLAAVAADGSEVGRIVGVHNFGAGDLIEVALGGSRRTELVPFTARFVPEVDLARRIVVVELPMPIDDNADDKDAPPRDSE